MTRFPAGLGEIAAGYDVLLCDIWGVIHNGREAFAEPCAALSRWRAERGPVVLISNSPRPTGALIEQLDELGVPRAAWSAIVTSGDATRDLLSHRAPGPALKIGPERDDPLYEGLDLDFTVSVEEATFLSCTGPVDDETETAEDYRPLLARAVERGLEMVCANPDKLVQRGDRLIPCAGALADVHKSLGGRVIMAGKPYAPIYDLCLSEAAKLAGASPDRARVLAIGDGLATDIGGANAQGLDALFIGSGIHGSAALGAGGGLDEAAVRSALEQRGLRAAFAMPALRW